MVKSFGSMEGESPKARAVPEVIGPMQATSHPAISRVSFRTPSMRAKFLTLDEDANVATSISLRCNARRRARASTFGVSER